MVVYENLFLKSIQNFLSKARLNFFLIVNCYKIIADQSETSALPAGCPSNWTIEFTMEYIRNK